MLNYQADHMLTGATCQTRFKQLIKGNNYWALRAPRSAILQGYSRIAWLKVLCTAFCPCSNNSALPRLGLGIPLGLSSWTAPDLQLSAPALTRSPHKVAAQAALFISCPGPQPTIQSPPTIVQSSTGMKEEGGGWDLFFSFCMDQSCRACFVKHSF